MDQKGTPTLDPNQPDPQTNGQQPAGGEQNANQYTRARIFLFISLPILILLFSTNTIVISIITTMIILLSIGSLFDPISKSILKYSNSILEIIFKPFELIWKILFIERFTRLANWLTRHRRSVIDVVAIIAIVILLGVTTLNPWFATGFGNLNDSVCLNTQFPWPTCDRGLGVSTLPGGDVHIGLIADNTYGSFDHSTLNTSEKQVEGLIFGENKRACAGQHITLIVVTMLSRTVEDATSTAEHSLQELQGSYLAQHDYNANHPAVSLCLAIANLGTADTANDKNTIAQVIHRIAQFAHSDPSLRGIVGFRNSKPAMEALDLIKAYQDLSTIPIISPSASSNDLSDVPNFYRIVSPDHSQGTALAQFFCDTLVQNQSSVSISILTDSTSAYSRSLQLAFSDAVKCVDPRQLTTTIEYKNYDAGSIQGAIHQALQQQPQPRYIFFPGYDIDMDTVEQQIHRDLKERASDVTIISGDGTNNADATTYYSYNRVYNTTFVSPLLETDPIVQSFKDLGFYLRESAFTIPSHVWVPADALLDFDAVNAFAQAERNVSNGDSSQNAFNDALKNINVPGKTGQIIFQGGSPNRHRSDRNQGYIYITCNDLGHNTHLIAQYSTINDGSNSPAENLSLSQQDGASPCT